MVFACRAFDGSTAEVLCGLKKYSDVEISQVMGRGFDVDRIPPPDEYPTVLIFTTGSGIRTSLNSPFERETKEEWDTEEVESKGKVRRTASFDEINDDDGDGGQEKTM